MYYANPPTAHRSACELNSLVSDVFGEFGHLNETQSIRLDLERAPSDAFVFADETMLGEAVAVLEGRKGAHKLVAPQIGFVREAAAPGPARCARQFER